MQYRQHLISGGLAISLAIACASLAHAIDASNGLAGSSWSLVRVDNVLPNGTRIELYGPKPQGLLVFDGRGHYSLQIFSASRSRFASNDKSKGSADEYKAAALGSNAHIGSYTLDEATHSLTFTIAHSSYPNWDGTVQKRAYTISGDTLRYIVPVPTSGNGATGEVEWKRIP